MSGALCAMCHYPIRGSIVTEGPTKDNPGTKHYHVGCVRRKERQRIASSTSKCSTEEAGENQC